MSTAEELINILEGREEETEEFETDEELELDEVRTYLKKLLT